MAAMRRILVIGASGFVGGALFRKLQGTDEVAGSSRAARPGLVRSPSLEEGGDWRPLLEGRDVVVHAAARVHVMKERACEPLRAYRAVNVAGTLAVAHQAAQAGVRRFVFISSIKVNGEQTPPGGAFAADDSPAPADPYGVSKAEAEAQLIALARRSAMEVVIVRPPLIYGPGATANFLSMMRWLARGIPLPLGAIEHNRRSLVALDNLLDLLTICLDHPAAANRIFLAADGEDLSTTGLLRRLAVAMGVPARLLPVPPWALVAGAAAAGRQAVVQRLCGSLQVDIAKTRDLLGWTPPVSVDEGLRRAARAFMAGRGERLA